MARLAHAQVANSERSFALDYRAPAACPDAAAVRTAIEERSVGATLVQPAAAAVRFTVELGKTGTSKLWVDLPEGSFRREFQAATCTEAVATMAVIAAMVLDAAPAARREMAEFPAADAPPPAPEPAKPADEPAPEAPQPPVPPPQPLPPQTPALPPASSSLSRPLRWSIALGGAFETAVAPTPPIAAVAGVEGFVEGRGWWAPGLRASVLVTATATEHVAAGDGKFRLIAGHLGTCPWRIPLGQSVRIFPCVSFEAGSLRAEGGGAAKDTHSATMPWLAGALAARAQLRLAGPFSLEAGVEGKLLARSDTFIFTPENQPENLIYQVPRFSLNLGLVVLLTL